MKTYRLEWHQFKAWEIAKEYEKNPDLMELVKSIMHKRTLRRLVRHRQLINEFLISQENIEYIGIILKLD
jgi:hypothetical protein